MNITVLGGGGEVYEDTDYLLWRETETCRQDCETVGADLWDNHVAISKYFEGADKKNYYMHFVRGNADQVCPQCFCLKGYL